MKLLHSYNIKLTYFQEDLIIHKEWSIKTIIKCKSY